MKKHFSQSRLFYLLFVNCALILLLGSCESFIDVRFLTNVTTKPVTNVTVTSALTGGIIKRPTRTSKNKKNKAEAVVMERGVCWSTSPNPTIKDNHTIDGSGEGAFNSRISGLDSNTSYYVRSYAVTDKGIVYGDPENFTTYVPEIITVSIPDGTFTMGSPDNEVDRGKDEKQHTVTLSSFRLSKYEITNQQFAIFLNLNKIPGKAILNSGKHPSQVLVVAETRMGLTYNENSGWTPVKGYENHPVVNVTWYGADEFASYVGGRLPTEAEWEYACRAGTTTPFYTGNCLSNAEANYNWATPYNTCTNFITTPPDGTHEVGTYPSNAWGLHDMHGNVWEWCSDWYEEQYPETHQTNPTGVAQGAFKVSRGGSWYIKGLYSRSACRRSNFPNGFDKTRGFRVAFDN